MAILPAKDTAELFMDLVYNLKVGDQVWFRSRQNKVRLTHIQALDGKSFYKIRGSRKLLMRYELKLHVTEAFFKERILEMFPTLQILTEEPVTAYIRTHRAYHLQASSYRDLLNQFLDLRIFDNQINTLVNGVVFSQSGQLPTQGIQLVRELPPDIRQQ